MLSIGDEVDRYVVEDEIGTGGMARVLKVRHQTLDAVYALKVLTITAPGLRERLVSEGRVQSQLNHPNVLRVLDVIDVDGTPGLLMDYVDGPELGQWLTEHQPSLDEALRLFDGIASGVRAAHEAGLVHRDLKPANILIATDHEGRFVPKVSDFGLVKAVAGPALRQGSTRSGLPMGTPAYMPPEQIRDASTVDERADVFALGCILQELVTGRAAFVGADPMELFDKVRAGDSEALPDKLPPAVQHTIRWCLQTEREARPSTVAEVQRALSGTPPAAPSVPPAVGVPMAWVAVASTLAVVGVVGGIALLVGLRWLTGSYVAQPCAGPTEGWVALEGGGLPREGGAWVARQDAPVLDDASGATLCTMPAGTEAEMVELQEPMDPHDPWVKVKASVGGGVVDVPELAVCYGDVRGWVVAKSVFTRPKKGATTWSVRPSQALLDGRPTKANEWSTAHDPRCEMARGSTVTLDGEAVQVRGAGTWVPVKAVR